MALTQINLGQPNHLLGDDWETLLGSLEDQGYIQVSGRLFARTRTVEGHEEVNLLILASNDRGFHMATTILGPEQVSNLAHAIGLAPPF